MTQTARPEIPRIPVPYGNRIALGNILDTVDSPVYNIRLYMLPWRDVAEGNFTADTKVVIAQTGVTGLLLDDVEIDLLSLPMQTFEPRRVSMTITEPGGVRFLDQLVSAREALGYVPEAVTMPLFMEIIFKGYDPSTGEFIDVTDPYRFRLELRKISFRVDTTGAVYDLDCVALNAIGQTDFYSKAPKEIETRGNTIREHLQAFVDALNLIEREHNNTHEVKDVFDVDLSALEADGFGNLLDQQIDYDNFNFLEFARLTNPELRDLSYEDFVERVLRGRIDGGGISVDGDSRLLAEADRERERIRRERGETGQAFFGGLFDAGSRVARGRTENNVPISIKRNTSYEFYMFSLFALSPEFYDLVFREEDSQRAQLVNRLILSTRVELGEYDPGRRSFARLVDYIPRLIPNNNETHAITARENSGLSQGEMQVRFSQLQLDKFYSYMFTGLNDQILDLDISYDKGHAILLTPYSGASQRVDSGVANPTDALTDDEATQRIDEIRRAHDQSNAHSSTGDSRLSGQLYLEDILDPPSVGPVQQRYEVGPSSTPNQASDEEVTVEAQARSNRLGMLYTNHSEEVSTFMYRQELQLRGDPYYLGRPGVSTVDEESAPEPRGDSSPRDHIGIRDTNSHYLLELQLPKTLSEDGDDDTGLRDIRSRSHFLTGVYMIRSVRNRFSNGLFTSTVTGVRQTAFDFADWQETVAESDRVFAEAAARNEPIPAPQLEVRDDEDDLPVQGSNPLAGDTAAVRSARNNNPGNIRATNIQWVGKTGNDGAFEIFDTQENGGRAMMINLRTRINSASPATMANIITAWAPPNENDTNEYIAFVTRETGIPANQTLDWNNRAQMTALARAIAIKEGGRNAIPSDWLSTAWWGRAYDRAAATGTA